MAMNYTAVPIPSQNPQSIVTAVTAIKTVIDVLTKQTANKGAAVVTQEELVIVGNKLKAAADYLSAQAGGSSVNVTWNDIIKLLSAWPTKPL